MVTKIGNNRVPQEKEGGKWQANRTKIALTKRGRLNIKRLFSLKKMQKQGIKTLLTWRINIPTPP